MAGKSTRFPGGKPKWMLTHPKTNGYMVMESMSGLNLDFFDQIIFVATKKQEEIFSPLIGITYVIITITYTIYTILLSNVL